MLETMRECLNDVFDLEGLLEVQRQVASRSLRIVELRQGAVPFARSLLFGYVGAFVYEGDVPCRAEGCSALAGCHAAAELLGKDGIKQLLDADVIARIEADLQCLSAERQVTTLEQAFDLLRTAGPFTLVELAERAARGIDVAEVIDTLIKIAVWSSCGLPVKDDAGRC